MTTTSTPQYDTPNWDTLDVHQTIRCGKHGVRREQDVHHASWIRREAAKRQLKASVSLGNGCAFVRLTKAPAENTPTDLVTDGPELSDLEKTSQSIELGYQALEIRRAAADLGVDLGPLGDHEKRANEALKEAADELGIELPKQKWEQTVEEANAIVAEEIKSEYDQVAADYEALLEADKPKPIEYPLVCDGDDGIKYDPYFAAKDREVAYEQNVVGLEIAWEDRIERFAYSAVNAILGDDDIGASVDIDSLQLAATEIVSARLLNTVQWENVDATDISDIAYEAVNREIDSRS